ncbi:NADH-quinone oxidoreductase subunit C [Reichenbachiella versicolor]|uniref:NADH-quinone oxidoreductase subunit C n=1 Tax=Reichenbachiella versicolor TaxID=1821036 RepID=UPI000D6E0CB4|nr:NADH-quinone oxidoreductase subunit C [Reichenbachiella versicolor]
MDIQGFKELIEEKLGDESVLGVVENSTPATLEVRTEKILEVLDFLHSSDQAYFDMLSCITAIDNGPEVNSMEVIYTLYSIPLEHSLMLKVTLDRENPEVESATQIWKTANWHEREAYDLFGIKFLNHPDLRRILMPADWEGYPLRKDYVEPQEYRGMKTIREEEDRI